MTVGSRNLVNGIVSVGMQRILGGGLAVVLCLFLPESVGVGSLFLGALRFEGMAGAGFRRRRRLGKLVRWSLGCLFLGLNGSGVWWRRLFVRRAGSESWDVRRDFQFYDQFHEYG